MRGRTMTELLTGPLARGPVLQELMPIWKSVPWRLSQRFWNNAGVEVFTSGEVPYVATNDGEQSRKALELYLTSLRDAERRGRREQTSYVLELGTGSGLFAKLFLDQLRERSRREGTEDYQRTQYLVCDYSAGLLEDTRQSGVFADHEDRVQRVHLPTMELRPALTQAAPEAVGAIRAIHANYVLDSLPFTILSLRGQQVFELRIRTRLRLETRPSAPPEDLDALCAWLEELGGSNGAHDIVEYETEYVPVLRDDLPRPHLIRAHLIHQRDYSTPESSQIVHSFGAVDSALELVGLLRSDGHFVAMDYGYQEASAEPIEFQCFGGSVASGVNFEQLAAAACSLSGVNFAAPETDPTTLHARLLGAGETPAEVIDRFRALYDRTAWDAIEAPYREAMELQQTGRYEAARWKFDAAHRLQPYNWSLMEAIVAFLTYSVSDHAAGLEVAKRALELNHLSPRLWNLLGDCYYGLDDLESAERAYQQAARVNPGDARARTNLAYIHLRRGAPQAALRMIGEALALDQGGHLRDELLAKQSEALEATSASQARSAFLHLNRLIGHHALPGRQK
jgi:tetratricopeptide (TPR) repeat protein